MPTEQQAYDLGAKGAPATEAERLLFEAWMRGHCWAVVGEWDGKTYKHPHESTGFVHGGAMETRRLWAAWRDRAALGVKVDAPADVNALLGEAHAQIKHLVHEVTEEVIDDYGLVLNIVPPSKSLLFSNCIAALGPLSVKIARHGAGVTATGEPISHVGESQFEVWMANQLLPAGGRYTKQDMRAAYAAGLGEQAAHLSGVMATGEALRHATKENGDCPSWCKACAAEAGARGVRASDPRCPKCNKPRRQPGMCWRCLNPGVLPDKATPGVLASDKPVTEAK